MIISLLREPTVIWFLILSFSILMVVVRGKDRIEKYKPRTYFAFIVGTLFLLAAINFLYAMFRIP